MYFMTNSITTTNIGTKERASLKQLASHHGLKQVEFINSAVDYFKKTGINPAQDIFSPREELTKLTKRVDQVIGFIKKNEQDHIHPLLDELIIISKKLDGQVSNQVSVKDLDLIIDYLNKIFGFIQKTTRAWLDFNEKQKEANIELANMMNKLGKEHSLMREMIAHLYRSLDNKSAVSSGFKKEDIQKFNEIVKQENALR